MLSVSEIMRALALRDLTDPARGPHAMQTLLEEIYAALPAPVVVVRGSPIVSVADNYNRLGYPADGAARDARYTRYVCEGAVLRTQTSAMIPRALREVRGEDVVIACPGMCYRRDAIDRLHVGEPHQVDLWRIARRPLVMEEMVSAVVGAALPGTPWRVTEASHPYTVDGLQIDACVDGEWIEIGECGRAAPRVLCAAGLDGYGGLAMGLGLDRLVMLRKRVPDIRLLRAEEPRIAQQMLDLELYREVSRMPPVVRDLSIAIDPPADAEALGDAVRGALGERAALVEAVEIVSVTAWGELPEIARARLGLGEQQVNVLLRLVLRALDRSLTHVECNALREVVYAAIHRPAMMVM